MLVVKKIEGLAELQAQFKTFPREVERGMASGLNRLGRSSVTASRTAMRQRYNIKSADINKGITRVPARAGSDSKGRSRLFTVIFGKGSRLGLHKFGGLPKEPKQEGIPVARRKPPTVKILKNAPRRKVQPDQYTQHKPFVARMTTGFGVSEVNHVGIFVRTAKWAANNKWRMSRPKPGRHQVIRELKAKGIAEIFQIHGRETLDAMLAQKGHDVMRHEVMYFIKKKMGQDLPPAWSG